MKVGEADFGKAGATWKGQRVLQVKRIQGPQSKRSCDGRDVGWSSPGVSGCCESSQLGAVCRSLRGLMARPEYLDLIQGQYSLVFKKNKTHSLVEPWHRTVRQASH